MYMAVQQSLGGTIRQLRRQQSMTQTELGGEHFSKSYVSAVERDKIIPSYDALHYFAEQLGQTRDYFENIYHERIKLIEMNGANHTNLETQTPHTWPGSETTFQDNFLLLLDSVLDHANFQPNVSQQHTFSDGAEQMIVTLPPQFQGRFTFLLGLQQMQYGNLPDSLRSFEHALTLAPAQYHPAILDALGMNYYLRKDYHIALNYFLRAARLLDEKESAQKLNGNVVENANGHDISQENGNDFLTPLRLKVHFHCGNAYRALGAQQQAKNAYEQAYRFLSATTDIQTVGELLLNLGYSTYAYMYQLLNTSTSPDSLPLSQEGVENSFQRATSFLVQSRTIYQIGEDRSRESQARLIQATVLLDTSTLRRQLAQKQAKQTGKPFPVTNTSLLDEAEEQCRQILMKWLPSHASSTTTPPLPAEAEIYLYGAMSRMIRIFIHRAITASLGGYHDTAKRERVLALHYCQQLLNSLAEETFPWSLVNDMATLQHSNVQYRMQPLPHLPSRSSFHHVLSQSSIYFATVAVAEALARASTHPDYIYEAYACSDRCLQLALDMVQVAYKEKLVDVSYVVRCYQRCITLLEEREEVAAEQEIQIDGTLRSILKDGLQKIALPLV